MILASRKLAPPIAARNEVVPAPDPTIPRCPKCGSGCVIETGCPRRGSRRHGGVLNPKTEPVACHRNDAHRHFQCFWWWPIGGDPEKRSCGHRWAR